MEKEAVVIAGRCPGGDILATFTLSSLNTV